MSAGDVSPKMKGAYAAHSAFVLNGQLIFGGSAGTAGDIPISQGPGLVPNWANISSAPITGPLLITDGTVSNPGLAFSTNPSTGIYWATNDLVFAVQGTEVGYFTTSGMVIPGTLQITGNVTGGRYNSQTISSAANFTGTVTIAGTTTLSNGVLALNSAAPTRGSGIYGINIDNVIDLSNAGSIMQLSYNQYFNGTDWIYTTTNYASRLAIGNDGLAYIQSPSGTVGTSATTQQLIFSIVPSGAAAFTNTVALPYEPVSGSNTLQIGATASFNSNSYELGIGLPSGATHWPFGIVNNGTVLFTVDTSGTVAINSGTANGLEITNSSGGPFALQFIRSDISSTIGWWNNAGVMQTNAQITSPSYVANPASGVKGLTINSTSGTSTNTDFQISRNGSAANNVGEGPSIQLQDTTNNDGAIMQMAGGQYEVWTNVAGAGWVQIFVTNGTTFYTRHNFEAQGIATFTSQCNFANNVWNVSADGTNRFYFAASADSYWEAHAGYHHFRNGSDADVVTIDMSGNVVANGNVSAGSDIKLKADIQPLRDALGKIKELNGITFRYKDQETRSTGLLAQDVEKVLPEAVGESSTGFKTLAYGNLAGLLVEAIKELDSKIDALAAKIEEL